MGEVSGKESYSPQDPHLSIVPTAPGVSDGAHSRHESRTWRISLETVASRSGRRTWFGPWRLLGLCFERETPWDVTSSRVSLQWWTSQTTCDIETNHTEPAPFCPKSWRHSHNRQGKVQPDPWWSCCKPQDLHSWWFDGWVEISTDGEVDHHAGKQFFEYATFHFAGLVKCFFDMLNIAWMAHLRISKIVQGNQAKLSCVIHSALELVG